MKTKGHLPRAGNRRQGSVVDRLKRSQASSEASSRRQRRSEAPRSPEVAEPPWSSPELRCHAKPTTPKQADLGLTFPCAQGACGQSQLSHSEMACRPMMNTQDGPLVRSLWGLCLFVPQCICGAPEVNQKTGRRAVHVLEKSCRKTQDAYGAVANYGKSCTHHHGAS